MANSDKWAIFDGDNTLWATEALYDDARVQLCELLACYGVPRELTDEYQRQCDASLQKTMGYSPARFPRSFVETMLHFNQHSTPEVVESARLLGEGVFDRNAETHENVDEGLERLKPHFRLALLTAGDDSIQTRRLTVFGRSHHFDLVRIVPRKDHQVLRTFLAEIGANPSSSWMIGDSLKSDIYPAIEVGMRAIHLDVPNWHPVEAGDLKLPVGVPQVANFKDAIALLLDPADKPK